VPRLNDDRLCWLALQDHIEKQSRRLGFLGWFSALAGAGSRGSGGGRRVGGAAAAGLAADLRREAGSDKRLDYAVAVDAASEQLTHEERLHLRATGEVPDWFAADVDQRVAALHKKGR
jgi:hypothetical protein